MVVRVLFGLLVVLFLCDGVSVGQPEPVGDLTTIVYPVADLVIPINAVRDSKKVTTDDAELMDCILKKVAPKSWDRAGGLGSMRFETKGGYFLHVRQTPAVHAELKPFLEKLQRGQVSLELRIVQVSDKALENCRIPWKESDGIEYALLDDGKLFQFFHAAQAEPTTHIMQSPKLTMFDGQDSKIEVGDWVTYQTGASVQIKDGAPVVVPKDEKIFVGLKTRFLPVISADRKHVTVQADIVLRNLISESVGLVPVTLPVPGPLDDAGKPTTIGVAKFMAQRPEFTEIKMAAVAKVPDQRTIALFAGKVLTEGKSEARPPVLSKIPYINRLFRNQAFGREANPLIFLLTPRILAEPETAHVERLRDGIQAEDDGQFPRILSQSNK